MSEAIRLKVIGIITEKNILELVDITNKRYYLKIPPTMKASKRYFVGQSYLFHLSNGQVQIISSLKES